VLPQIPPSTLDLTLSREISRSFPLFSFSRVLKTQKKSKPESKTGAQTERTTRKSLHLFAAMEGPTWTPPKYKQPQKKPFILAEREINDLIAGMNKTLSAFLQFLKESASRRGEAFNVKWTDLDLVNRTTRITAEKGSFPRIF